MKLKLNWTNWGKNLVLLSVPLLLYSLLLAFPLPRQIGLTFRYGFSTTLLILVVIFTITYWIPGWLGNLIGITATLIIFALPLSGLWSSGQSEQYILGGLLPFSDAMNYHSDAQRLLEGMSFSSFSGRRPIFSAFLSVLLVISNRNLQVTMAIFVVITAFACFLAVREIQRTHGIGVCVFFILLLFLFYRPLIGKTLTEHMGLTYGVIGFTLIWYGARERKKWSIFLGIFFISLALNARAGAFFTLPALVIWAAWLFRGNRPISFSTFGWSCLAVILGFIVNIVIFRTLVGNGAPFSNFAHTLYGLVSGGNSWTHIYAVHPEVWNLDEPELSRTIYRYSYELFIGNPGMTLKGALKTWGEFFSLEWYSAFCFIGGDKIWVEQISRLGMYLLCLFGLLRWFFRPNDEFSALIIAVTIGIILSVPFVPPMDSNRMRVHAAIIPFFILLPGMGFLFVLEKIKLRIFLQTITETLPHNIPIMMGLGLMLITIIGPLIIKYYNVPTQYEEVECSQGLEAVYMRISKGSYIKIVDNNAITQDWLPQIRINKFQLTAHNLPNWEYYPIFDEVSAKTTIVNGINLENGEFVLLISDSDMMPDEEGVFGMCGIRNKDIQTVFYPASIVYSHE